MIPSGQLATLEEFPNLQEHMSPLIHHTTSPLIPTPIVLSPSPALPEFDVRPLSPLTDNPPLQEPLTITRAETPRPEIHLINPLDRPSSPTTSNPFMDPLETHSTSAALSRTTSSHTLSLQEEEYDNNSMSDWTDAFEQQTESEGPSDMDSESDVVSDAESEASWARVRSRAVGYN